MENITYQFKTNFQCANCVSKIQKDFDQESGIIEWHVDTNHVDKILRVTTQQLSTETIMKMVDNKGFEISLLSS